MQQGVTLLVTREEIMASGLGFNKKGNFSEDIQQKINSLVSQYIELNDKESQVIQDAIPQTQILQSPDEIPVYNVLDMDYFESESESEHEE